MKTLASDRGWVFKATGLSRPSGKPALVAQRGMALVLALILLAVLTLAGLASVRGTLGQQKMAASLHGRQMAFQSAEAALRIAQLRIAEYPGEIARQCRTGSTACLSNPFDDPNLPPGGIRDVGDGSVAGQFHASAPTAGGPQYVIENMGSWVDPEADASCDQSIQPRGSGHSGGSVTAVYYRITARSGDPADIGDQAMVVLQAVVIARNGNGAINQAGRIIACGKTYIDGGIGLAELPNNPILAGSTPLVSFGDGSNRSEPLASGQVSFTRVSWRELIDP